MVIDSSWLRALAPAWTSRTGEQMHVYLAGPMSGKEQFNYPAFREAASVLRDWGYEVTNPVEIDDVAGVRGVISQSFGLIEKSGWAECLGRDVARIADSAVDGVVVLPGWQQSKGASLEVHVAQALGKFVVEYPDMASITPSPTAETILGEAERLVGGDRGDDYGHPYEDFSKTAGAWESLFGWKCSPSQVALAMIVVKLSRLQVTPQKRDSIVDIAGYARTYEMVLDYEGTPAKKYSEQMPLAYGHNHRGGAEVSLDDVKAAWDRVNNDPSPWDKLTADVNDVATDMRNEQSTSTGRKLRWPW